MNGIRATLGQDVCVVGVDGGPAGYSLHEEATTGTRVGREHTMIGFLLGAATGYVLGAKAGRERYEQIVRTYHRIADHPAVQSAADTAKEKVADAVRTGVKSIRGHSDESSETVVHTEPRQPVTAVRQA
jgi:hypothetical protein